MLIRRSVLHAKRLSFFDLASSSTPQLGSSCSLSTVMCASKEGVKSRSSSSIKDMCSGKLQSVDSSSLPMVGRCVCPRRFLIFRCFAAATSPEAAAAVALAGAFGAGAFTLQSTAGSDRGGHFSSFHSDHCVSRANKTSMCLQNSAPVGGVSRRALISLSMRILHSSF